MRVLNAFADYLEQAFHCDSSPVFKVDGEAGLIGSAGIPVFDIFPENGRFPHSSLERLRETQHGDRLALITCDSNVVVSEPRQLSQFLERKGFCPLFTGWLPDDTPAAHRMLAVVGRPQDLPLYAAPRDFRVVAIIAAYNEADIIDHTIRYLVDQGIEVHIIDNWSTDSTYARAQAWLHRGVIGLERFPKHGPATHYEWRQLLARVEQLSTSIAADWFVLYDCDERRRSPWPEISYKGGIYHADRCGFNCIDHVVLNHWPTGERIAPERDVEEQIRSCSFSDHLGHFHQRKAWKNLGIPVLLAASAGHDITFPNRRVYPFKFLLKHFPIRSQSQAEQKIFRDRMPRWNPQERALGWHTQYDEMNPNQRFIWDPRTLPRSDAPEFYERFLIERLSGIGIFREPPEWATPPVARTPHLLCHQPINARDPGLADVRPVFLDEKILQSAAR